MSKKVKIELIERGTEFCARECFVVVKLKQSVFNRAYRVNLPVEYNNKALVNAIQYGIQCALNGLEADLDAYANDKSFDHYDRLCASAKHFGLAVQKAKTKEEMDELAELLGDYSVPDRALRAARIEELADVYNMLDQLCILWDCEDEVRDTAERKMERTMERIASGYYEGKANG